jgi:hypothetical protein
MGSPLFTHFVMCTLAIPFGMLIVFLIVKIRDFFYQFMMGPDVFIFKKKPHGTLFGNLLRGTSIERNKLKSKRRLLIEEQYCLLKKQLEKPDFSGTYVQRMNMLLALSTLRDKLDSGDY